ncbi:MAG: hypothetical protein GY761_18075, partial [Hyphomicrobiales bacterium]|nr:hypothetical protein [Hyphomicrobiales bacterium]
MTQTGKLLPLNTVPSGFGESVSISGNSVVVGSLQNSGDIVAYVFEKPVSGWQDMTQTADLNVTDDSF